MSRTILVVDDDRKTVDLIRLYLEKDEYQVLVAYDGRQALETTRLVHPDLIILDLMLPKIDGLDVCRTIRAETEIPIIMLTAKTTEDDKLVGLDIGADDYITKPFSPREPLADGKGISLNAVIDPDLPFVFADPERVRQVLRNLLDNALAYTPSSGNVSIEAGCHNGMVAVSVRDTGSGIAPEHLPFIFERFYRVDKSRTRSTGGAGLGLAIVRQIVEAQGGQVSIDSTLEKGTAVTFTLPKISDTG